MSTFKPINNIHPNKPTSPSNKNQRIVIPCPDFLYSTMEFDVSKSLLAISLQDCDFNNFALYDSNGRCTVTESFVNTKILAIICGPSVKLNDDEIKILVNKTVPLERFKIFRIPLVSGAFLHRLLIPDPKRIEETISIQHKTICTTIPLPIKMHNRLTSRVFTGNESWTSLAVVLACNCIAFSVLVILFLAAEEGGVREWRWRGLRSAVLGAGVWSCGSFVGGIIAAVAITLMMRKFFWFAHSVIRFETMGPWQVSWMFTSEKNANPFSNMMFFLHGALGLPPSEVLYGTALEDSEGDKLRSAGGRAGARGSGGGEAAYVIEADAVDFDCAWWSITVYGHDKFLVPNENNLFSVNSKDPNLYWKKKSGGEGGVVAGGGVRPGTPPRPRLQIYCSASKPDPRSAHAALPWLPLPPPSAPGRGEFRLLFRAYLPGAAWLDPGAAAHKIRLPAIRKLS